jgi:hypothetical protein
VRQRHRQRAGLGEWQFQHHIVPARIDESEPDHLPVAGDVAGGQLAALDFHQVDRRDGTAVALRHPVLPDDGLMVGQRRETSMLSKSVIFNYI